MKFSVLVAFLTCGTLLSGGLYAAKKKKPEPAKTAIVSAAKPLAIPQMTPEQKTLHALNRMTFGARPGDVEAVNKTGLDNWIDQQLHPDRIAENPILETKLMPLETLRMGSAEMMAKYPSQQLVKAMVDGRQPFPTDPASKAMIEKLVARYQRKEAADATGKDANMEADSKIVHVALSQSQKDLLASGRAPEQAKMIADMPEADQWDLLDSMAQGSRQRMFNAATPDLRRKIQMFNGPQQVVNQDLIEGKMLRAIYSNRQLEEVLTDFWYNHFNVYLDKGADRYMVTAYERDVIKPHVLGHFKDLLMATAQSPAMLFYLDNYQSVGANSTMAGRGPAGKRRSGLNENYGRELMELHTLGVDGGYTQADVTEVARCFTGWTIRDPQRGGGFEFNDRLHDNGEKHVLGVTISGGGGMEDGLKVLDILAHQPATAKYVSGRLAVRFVSDNPSPALVDKMAATFTATDGDLTAVMKTMLSAPEFWAASNFRSKVKSPLEMLSSAVRAVNGDVDYAFTMAGQLNQLGEPLYRKAEPTGYSNKSGEWMNSAALLARMNFAMALAQNKVPGVKVDTTQFSGESDSISRKLLSVDASADAKAAIAAGMKERLEASNGVVPASTMPPADITAPGGKKTQRGPLAGNRPNNGVVEPGALVAGLTLGSPDFQRR